MEIKETAHSAGEKKRTFKVKGLKKDFNKWYYIVDYEGVERLVKLFDYQKEKETPEELQCIIKIGSDGSEIILQDLVPIIASRYIVGQRYKMKVKSGTERIGQYDVVSPEGLIFHLLNPKRKKYEDRQDIYAEVLDVNGIKVNLVEVEDEKENREPQNSEGSLTTIDSIYATAEASGIDTRILRLFKAKFSQRAEFAAVRKLMESGTIDWFADALNVTRETISEWLMPLSATHRIEVLKALQAVCVNIMERSNLLTQDNESTNLAKWELSETIHTVEDYMTALEKIRDGNIESYAADICTSLLRTGCLFEPWRRLSVLCAGMTMKRELLKTCGTELLDVVGNGNIATWKKGAMRNAIVGYLDRFTTLLSAEADNVTDVKQKENGTLVAATVRALGMLLLLVDEQDGEKRRLAMSRLCRYASLYNEPLAIALTDKAYASLFGKMFNTLPFNWADTQSASTLSFKVSQMAMPIPTDKSSYIEGRETVLTANADSVCLQPSSQSSGLRNVLTGEESKDIKILIDKEIKLPADEAQQDKWDAIERALFDKTETKKAEEKEEKKPKMFADVGDVVTIRITGKERFYDKQNNPKFHCVIEDALLKGEGNISPRDIVHYNVMDAQPTNFVDNEGRPMLFNARVDYIGPNDEYHFTMLDMVDSFISTHVSAGETLLCRMTINLYGDSLLVSEAGYSLRIPKTDNAPELNNGELVWVETTAVYPDGKIDATFIERADPNEAPLRDRDNFSALLKLYANGAHYEGGETLTDSDVAIATANERKWMKHMTLAEAREVMHIVDRKGAIDAEKVTATAYRGMAKLIARSIGDDAKAEEYAERMKLESLIEQYAAGEAIDIETFRQLYGMNNAFSQNKDLKDKALRLYCATKIDEPEAEQELLNIATENQGTTASNTARLVLAYRLTEGEDQLSEARGVIKSLVRQYTIKK